MKAIIIGSGIGGLGAAVRLRLQGYEVEVFEKASGPGGKLREIRSEGFRWDAGPSLFTMPQFVEELFELAGKKAEDHFQFTQLPVITNYFYEDGNTKEISDWSNGDLEGWYHEFNQNILKNNKDLT